jgi:hypothetical protein
VTVVEVWEELILLWSYQLLVLAIFDHFRLLEGFVQEKKEGHRQSDDKHRENYSKWVEFGWVFLQGKVEDL